MTAACPLVKKLSPAKFSPVVGATKIIRDSSLYIVDILFKVKNLHTEHQDAENKCMLIDIKNYLFSTKYIRP